MRLRKREEFINAFQFSFSNIEELMKALPEGALVKSGMLNFDTLITKNGKERLSEGDWIVLSDSGECSIMYDYYVKLLYQSYSNVDEKVILKKLSDWFKDKDCGIVLERKKDGQIHIDVDFLSFIKELIDNRF